jgi:type I restriction enzyme S subunit
MKRAVRTASAGAVSIKGDVSSTEEPDLFPGFSASGQDVWLDRAPFAGPGFVLSAVGARCGKVFLASGRWGVVANTAVLLPRDGNHAKYLWYALNREDWWQKGGTAQPYVRIEESLTQAVYLPSCAEQQRLADFLDRETQRIDLARHQIQSLEQAFNERSRAVQGRLLLEDVEESQRPIWSCVSLNPDTLPEDTDADVEFEYIDISSVSSDGIADLESVAFVSAPSRARRIVRERDVIISTVRTYLRAVAAVPSSLDGAVASTGFAVLRPLPAVVDGRYLRYWCMTDAFLSEVVARSYGVSYPAINASELVRLKMPVPSMARQVKVVTELEALEHQTAKQRHYLSLLDSLLSERRQALIAATVTGQLDVEAVA